MPGKNQTFFCDTCGSEGTEGVVSSAVDPSGPQCRRLRPLGAAGAARRHQSLSHYLHVKRHVPRSGPGWGRWPVERAKAARWWRVELMRTTGTLLDVCARIFSCLSLPSEWVPSWMAVPSKTHDS